MPERAPARNSVAITREELRLSLRSVHSEERLVKNTELADMLDVSPQTVDRMRRKGMPHIRWGQRLIRYRPSEALAWLEEQN